MANGKGVKKEVEKLAKKLEEEIKKIGSLEELKKTMEEIEKIEKQIEELRKTLEEKEIRKHELISALSTMIETVDKDFILGLYKLGVNGEVETIAGAILKVELDMKRETDMSKAKVSTKGIGNRKINFRGKIYNIAQYFMRKYGISGGLEGLKQWAKENGYDIEVLDDVIIIK